jgi:hypothetical protein
MDVTIIFTTNYTLDIPNIDKQQKTIESFYDTFKISEKLPTFIFCDEKPISEIKGEIELFNGSKYSDYKIPGDDYINNLKNIELLKEATIIKTNSLCDGYKQALSLCKTKYLFFLEHDWVFLNNITHNLTELTDIMDKNNEINCILFNKLSNIQLDFQIFYNSKNYEIPLLLTNRQSNNPNLLRVDHAKKFRNPIIKSDGCSVHPGLNHHYCINNMKVPSYCGGIECELCDLCGNDENKVKLLGTYLYGELNKKPTIIHSDGCNRTKLNKESYIERNK